MRKKTAFACMFLSLLCAFSASAQEPVSDSGGEWPKTLSRETYDFLLNNLRQASSKLESWNASLETREAGLSKRELDLNKTESNLIEREAALRERESLTELSRAALVVKEQTLSKREAILIEREKALPENELIIKELKDSLTKASESSKTFADRALAFERKVFFLKIISGVCAGFGIAGVAFSFISIFCM